MKGIINSKYTPKHLLICLLLLYVFVYTIIYKLWLTPHFEYFGFNYTSPGIVGFILIIIFVIAPALIAPVNVKRPSMILYWMIYFVVYIPSIITPFFVQLMPFGNVIELCFYLCLGNCILAIPYYFSLYSFRYKRFNTHLFNVFSLSFSVILLLYVLYIYKNNLRIVSFNDVYDLRFEGGDLASGNLVGYAVMILSGCLFPFWISVGLIYKRYSLLIFGICGQVLLYSTAAMKSIVLSVLVIVLQYFLVSKNSNKFLIPKILGLLLFLCFFLLYIGQDIESSSGMLASLLFLRTIGIPGLITAQYHHYFSFNPVTYYSHVSGINYFVDYPYDRALGLVVGEFYFGNDLVNSNANFWMTDGVAALGPPGLVVISIILAVIFWLIDSFSKPLNIKLIILWLSYTAINLSNGSLFTTLLSGGFGLIILLIFLMPRNLYAKSSNEN